MNKKDITKFGKIDLIVVGAGGSGLAAAVSAHEAGVKKIVILESGKKPGGNSVFPTGIFGADTKLQKSLGALADKDVIFRRSMDYAHWKLNGKLLRNLINRSSDTIDWLISKGVVLNNIIPLFNNFDTNTYHSNTGDRKIGLSMINLFQQICEKVKIPIFTKTRAQKILTNKKGEVTGVSVLFEGEHIDIKAKAVVIATGGILGNTKLMSKYDPLYNKDEVLFRGIRHKGDGFFMSLEAGASTDHELTVEMESPTFRDSPFLTAVCKYPETIWVNKSGERFTDEDVRTNEEASNAIYRQPGKTCYVVFDNSLLQEIIEGELIPFAKRITAGKPFKEGVVKAIDKLKNEDKIKVSKSINMIAKWIGADLEIFKKTLDDYNGYCENGYDAEFGKKRKHLRPIITPPFYVIPCQIALLMAHCGIRVNHNTQALDQNNNIIPGLYVVGADMAGTAANTYNIRTGGNSFGFAVGSGRIAGEQAAIQINQNR